MSSKQHLFGATPVRSIILTACLSILMFINGGSADADELTLEDSIRIALENNPAIHIADEDIRQSDATAREAISAGMPKLSLEGTYQRVDSVPRASFGDMDIELGSIDSRSADLVLVQPIDVFGAIGTARNVARTSRSIYHYGYDRQINDTTLDTKLAFYNVLRAQEFLKVQEGTIAQLEAHIRDAEAHYAAGTIAKFDVLRAETQLANSQQGLIAAQNGVELAKAAFNNVLGRSLDEPVDLAQPEMIGFVNLDMSSCIESATLWRPEVLQTQALMDVNEGMVKAAELSGRPRFNLRWMYNRNFDVNMFNPNDSSWRAFLTANVSLFDGGANRAAVDKAKSVLNSSTYQLEQVTNGVVLDTRQSYLSLRESRERVQAAEKGLEQARESLRLAQVRYKAGVSTQVELLDSQVALTLAETNRVNAFYDYQSSLAKLERAVGGTEQMMALIEGRDVASIGEQSASAK